MEYFSRRALEIGCSILLMYGIAVTAFAFANVARANQYLRVSEQYVAERVAIDSAVVQFARLCVVEYGTNAPDACIRQCWQGEMTNAN